MMEDNAQCMRFHKLGHCHEIYYPVCFRYVVTTQWDYQKNTESIALFYLLFHVATKLNYTNSAVNWFLYMMGKYLLYFIPSDLPKNFVSPPQAESSPPGNTYMVLVFTVGPLEKFLLPSSWPL